MQSRWILVRPARREASFRARRTFHHSFTIAVPSFCMNGVDRKTMETGRAGRKEERARKRSERDETSMRRRTRDASGIERYRSFVGRAKPVFVVGRSASPLSLCSCLRRKETNARRFGIRCVGRTFRSMAEPGAVASARSRRVPQLFLRIDKEELPHEFETNGMHTHRDLSANKSSVLHLSSLHAREGTPNVRPGSRKRISFLPFHETFSSARKRLLRNVPLPLTS